jgi:hypothetical protein
LAKVKVFPSDGNSASPGRQQIKNSTARNACAAAFGPVIQALGMEYRNRITKS